MMFPSKHAARRSADGLSAHSSSSFRKLQLESRLPAFVILLLNFIFAAPFFCPPARAQEVPEYRLKAAFLFNFGKFVEWPTNAFASTDAPIIIGVFGKDPFQGELESIVKNKTINGHPLAVRKINRLPNLKQCRIVFISASEAGHLTAIFREISGAPILTVGDRNGFIRAGGMIQFVTEQNEIRFEINDEAARRTGLKISSKLLMLSIRLKQNDG